MIAKLRLSIYFMAILLIVGHSFQRVRADYAPEKMTPDDEARQEMRLDSRSFIPHPRPNRAEVSAHDQARVLAPHKEEPEEKRDGSGDDHKDEEEVVKDDEGSSNGSGEESISLSSHEETKSQKQGNLLSVRSPLTDEHRKSLSSPVVIHSPESKAMLTMNESQLTPVFTQHTSAQNTDPSNKKSAAKENKLAENASPEAEDEKDNDNSDTIQQEGSAVVDSQNEEAERESAPNKEDVGNLTSQKDDDDTEDDRDNDDDQSGNGSMDKAKTSEGADEEEDEKKSDDKDAENEDRENVDHSDENDKRIKDDNDDKEEKDNDEDTNSGSGDLPAKKEDKTPKFGSSRAPESQGASDKDMGNHSAKEDDEKEDDDEDSEKDSKMEDAVNNENEEADEEDEDEENESRIEIKEQKDLQSQTTTSANQTVQQSTVHKLTKKNVSHVQTSPKEPPLRSTQEQIHQLSTIHKVKKAQRFENESQKSRKIYVQHASSSTPSEVHKEKNVANSKALLTNQARKPTKQHTVVKAAHLTHSVNLKHHKIKHNDKNHDKPRKSKGLLKYIHRTSLHKKRGEAKLNKTTPHKCNSDDVKHGYSLKGGTRAGHVEDLGELAGMHECIQRCCHKKVCDVALMLDGRCFGIACYSRELCEPVIVPHPHYVNSQIAFLNRAQRRDEVEGARPELDCKYGELTIRNNHRWSGELCGGVVTCRNGVVTVEKCPSVPPKPTDCANPILEVHQRPGQCCIKKWTCKDKSCEFVGRRIPHGVSLSDQLCTGVVKCMNGHLEMKECPALPKKPTNCAHPKLKITTVPGKCCKKRWTCPDKSCSYGELKIDDGERLTDASCAVVMECKNGFLDFKQCPDPPPIPNACLNPTLKVKRILGECCHRKWACAQETK